MPISVDQNSEQNLRRIAAQSHTYSQAKCVVAWRKYGSLVVAVSGIVAGIIFPEYKIWTALGGAIWAVIVTLLLKDLENSLKLKAARIQEEFDCELFGQKWNHAVAGEKVSREFVTAADRKFRRDRNKLRDWYGDLDGIASPLDALVCQRQSLVWDWRLQRSYGRKVGLKVLFFFLAGLGWGVYQKMLLLDYLLLVLAPSSGVIMLGYEFFRKHIDIADKKEEKEREITALIDDAFANHRATPAQKIIRSIQDTIFELRSESPLVSDGWYDRLRDEYQLDMKTVLEDFRSKARQASLK